MKCTVTEMKNSLEGLKRKTELAEQRTNELEDKFRFSSPWNRRKKNEEKEIEPQTPSHIPTSV